MLQSEGPVNWEVAEQVATWTSSVDPETGEPTEDPEPDPGATADLEDLVRAAQTHAASATGITGVFAVPVSVVTRREWAATTLIGLHEVVEVLAATLGHTAPPHTAAGPAAGPATAGDLTDLGDLADLLGGSGGPGTDPFAGLMAMVGPVVVGVQAGTMIGFLAQHTLGRYDLALPLSGDPSLAFVLSNVDSFAAAWSLPIDDLRFALALRESVHAAQRSVPWVRARLLRLSCEYVAAYRFDPGPIEEQLAALDVSDPESWSPAAGIALDPSALLDAMRTPEQEPVLRELQRFAALLEGYTDAVVDRTGEELVPSLSRIDEALRRHRVERGRCGGVRRPPPRPGAPPRALRAGCRLLPRSCRAGGSRGVEPTVVERGDGADGCRDRCSRAVVGAHRSRRVRLRDRAVRRAP